MRGCTATEVYWGGCVSTEPSGYQESGWIVSFMGDGCMSILGDSSLEACSEIGPRSQDSMHLLTERAT